MEPNSGHQSGPVTDKCEKAFKKTPPERLRAHEQGIDEVPQSGVTEKASKVGAQAPDFCARGTARFGQDTLKPFISPPAQVIGLTTEDFS
jgi:hypothetical protein